MVCGPAPTYLPLSHSSDNSAIFVLVMSLWDAKNNTTSRFSFLMGTISNKHQNGVPVNKTRNTGINAKNVVVRLVYLIINMALVFYYLLFSCCLL